MADTADPPIYANLMKVKPPELKPGTWARRAGLARNIFNDIRAHGNPKRETVGKLLDAIGVSWAQFEALSEPIRSEVAGAGVTDIRAAFEGDDRLPPLKLLGTAMGAEDGDLEEDVDLTELHIEDVLDWLPRPAVLARDNDAYALTILNDSMAPRYEPGERVGVSPRSPISIGDYVIVYLRRGEGEDERIHMVLIKRLKRRGAGFVELEQFNPPKIFRIENRRVAKMHKVRVLLPS